MLNSEEGLNINYSSAGRYGKAIYTAYNASYSCPNWSFKSGDTYKVFLVNVLIGDAVKLDKKDESLREPPKK